MPESSKRIIHDISASAIFKVIAVFALCAAFFYLRGIVIIVLVAVVIASAIEPGTKWFMKHSVPRVAAVILQYLILALLLAIMFYFLVIPLIGEAISFTQSLPNYVHSAELLGTAGKFGAVSSTGSTLNFTQSVVDQLNSAVTGLSQGFFSTLSTVFGGVFNFLLIIVISIYLAVQEKGISHFLAAITPATNRKYVLSLWDRSEIKIGRWMQGQLILAAVIFIVDYVGLLAFGLPHALLLAFFAAFFEIIPVIGPIIAGIPGILLAISSGGLTFGFVILIFYTLVQQLENHIVYPLVVKKVVGVPPLVSIIALLAGGELFGFLGIVISVPVAAVLMEVMNDNIQPSEIDESTLPQ
jgi:predicted PurR-regulated permease PerM